jgi:hypothetical protein
MQNRFPNAKSDSVITLAVLLLALIPRLLGLAVFWTVDEPFYYDCALLFGRALKAANWAETLGPPGTAGVPSVTTRWLALIGIGVGRAHRFALQALGLLPASVPPGYPRDLAALAAARLPGAVITALAVAAVYVILRRVAGRRAACFAALFLALDPLYLALSRIVGNDALHASFALLAVLALGLTFLRSDRRWMLVFGACAGLAFLSKSPALILLPLLPVLGALLNFALLERPRPIGWALVALAIGYFTTAVVTVALWPALWAQPVATLRGILEFGGHAPTNSNFFLGHSTSDPGPLYYPISVALRLNPFAVLGLLAALAAVAVWLRRGARRPAPTVIVWTILLGVLAVAYLVLLSFAPKKSDHYALPIILASDVVGALGMLGLVEWLAGAVRRNARAFVIVGGMIVAAYGVYTCVWAYPYYSPAYNPLLGGLPAATRTEMVGWGEGIERAAVFLNSQPNASSLRVGGYNLISLPGYFHGPKTSSRPRPLEQLDYYVDYISWRQRNMIPLGFEDLAASTPPAYSVGIGGVSYAAVYRIPKDRYRMLPDGATAVDATYADGLRLAGYRPQPLRRSAAGWPQAAVSLFWQADASCDRKLRLKVNLVNGAGTVWGERSVEPPCGDPDGWRADLIVRDDVSLDVLVGTPPGDYALQAVMVDTRNGYEVPSTGGLSASLGTAALGGVTLPRDAPVRPASLAMEHVLDAGLGESIRLLGYDVAGSSRAGETLTFTAYWHCLRPLDRRYRVFINLLNPSGEVVAASDADPADGFYPTDAWTTDEVIRDPHRLTFADERAAEAVGLEIGLYDPATGERLPVTLAGGERPADRAVRLGGH